MENTGILEKRALRDKNIEEFFDVKFILRI